MNPEQWQRRATAPRAELPDPSERVSGTVVERSSHDSSDRLSGTVTVCPPYLLVHLQPALQHETFETGIF